MDDIVFFVPDFVFEELQGFFRSEIIGFVFYLGGKLLDVGDVFRFLKVFAKL